MKALAIDCAVSKITIAAKNDDYSVSTVFDIGMRQSEILVPAIDEILTKAGLNKAELDYTTLTVGPGSFTGLRLVISALKAIELAFGTPIYAISSLKAYAYPYQNFELPLLACIDANKDRYYANFSNNGKEILEDGDWEIEKIVSEVSKFEKVLISGPDAKKLATIILDNCKKTKPITLKTEELTTQALFALAEDMLNKNEPPLKDFDGPVYLRASEAEVKLNASKAE